MVTLFVFLSMTCLVMVVSTQEVAAQSRRVSSEVFLSYSAPSRLTLHEPVSLAVHLQNSSGESVFADLGKNSFGRSQLILQRPDGSMVRVDPSRPTQADEAYFNGRIQVDSGQHYTEEAVLDQWLDFSDEGIYRLSVEFEGTIRSASNQAADVQRKATMVIQILPRNENTLRATTERLVRQMQALSAKDAILAAKKLSYLRDPIVVDYIRHGLDDPRQSDLNIIALRGLERIGTDEARQALVDALGNTEPSVSAAAVAALNRLDARQKR